MKKLIAYIIAWTLFWMGHLTSYIPRLYSLYKWFMFKSMSIQDWAGNKTPWTHVNKTNE